MIDPKIWSDARFIALPRPRDKLLFIYLLTCSSSQHVPGMIEMGIGGLVDKMHLTYEEARESLQALVDIHLIEFDCRVNLIRLPRAPKYALKDRKVANDFALRGWFHDWKMLPECEIKYAFVHTLKAAIEQWVIGRNCDQAKRDYWADAWNRTFGSATTSTTSPTSGITTYASQQFLPGTTSQPDVVTTSPKVAPTSSEIVSGVIPLNPSPSIQIGLTLGQTLPLIHDQDHDQDQDQRSRSRSSSGSETTSPGSKKRGRGQPADGSVLNLRRFRDKVEAKWSKQEEMRAEIPGLRPLRPDDERLARIADLYAEGYTDEDMDHVLLVYQQCAMNDARGKTWFNGETNWIRRNFLRTLGQAPSSAPEKTSTGHVKIDGTEQYPPTGDVKIR